MTTKSVLNKFKRNKLTINNRTKSTTTYNLLSMRGTGVTEKPPSSPNLANEKPVSALLVIT